MRTECTFDTESLSDLFKDACGYRAPEEYYENWDLMDDDEKQEEWDKLISALEAENEAERKFAEVHTLG